MKELIAKKVEEYRSEQSKLLSQAKEHEDTAQRMRADAIAYGGAIQACEQILAMVEKHGEVPTTNDTAARELMPAS